MRILRMTCYHVVLVIGPSFPISGKIGAPLELVVIAGLQRDSYRFALPLFLLSFPAPLRRRQQLLTPVAGSLQSRRWDRDPNATAAL
ncbi:hypothetical protein NDU88_006598 [Pleurodeles waltl]|uniref:Uncharacterized protein n=1 Tax=Pleurodeles waltl TaxID=8319 RepID=A0AAV7WB89_PLEWA|nr:hypothetical protein NDU88_006598 [Pleurodeles waltl]